MALMLGTACSDDGVPADNNGSTSGATSGDPSSASGVTQSASGSNGETEAPPSSTGPGMETEGSTGSTGSTTSEETGTTTGTGTSSGTDTDTDTDTGSGSSSSTGAGGDGDLEFEIESIDFWQNCQPVVAADPVLVYATINVVNNTNVTASAIVDSARFIDDSDMTAITFELSPSETGDIPGNTEVSMDFQKVMDSSSVQNFCNTLSCGDDYRVEIVFEDGLGDEVLVSDEEALSCPV
jgi:hypothetical protein